MPPDITRLFKGPDSEFEVEVVFAQLGDKSPRESHPFHEIILILEGSINLERSDEGQTKKCKPRDLIEISPGVDHVLTVQETPTKLLVIHPERC